MVTIKETFRSDSSQKIADTQPINDPIGFIKAKTETSTKVSISIRGC